MSKTKVIEVFDRTQTIMQIGTDTKGRVITVAVSVDELETLNSDYINDRFGDLQDTAYQRGFEDGKWKSEDGCTGCKYEGKVVTGPPCISCCNSYKNQWTAKSDKIEVGDFVYDKTDTPNDWAIVTWTDEDESHIICGDGSTNRVCTGDLRKTGRHFDIASILEDMRHD